MFRGIQQHYDYQRSTLKEVLLTVAMALSIKLVVVPR